MRQVFHALDSASVRSLQSSFEAALLQRSVVLPFGDGLSAYAIKPWQYLSWILPREPQFEQKIDRGWTYIKESGVGSHWDLRNMLFLPLKIQAFKPEYVNILQSLRRRESLYAWNMNTGGAVP